MKCPKCGYTSFDYLDSCKKCGIDLRELRTKLQIIAVSPDERAGMVGRSSPAVEEPAPSASYGYDDSAVATDFSELSAPEPAQEDGDAILADLNFDESFADMVEPTSYRDATASPAPAGSEEDEGLLDIDFGDVFADKDKPGS
jgi:hypothetical protein